MSKEIKNLSYNFNKKRTDFIEEISSFFHLSLIFHILRLDFSCFTGISCLFFNQERNMMLIVINTTKTRMIINRILVIIVFLHISYLQEEPFRKKAIYIKNIVRFKLQMIFVCNQLISMQF